MAGTWLPKTGAEFFEYMARESRIMARRPKGQTAFEDDEAIDASTAPDTEPLDYYVDGQDEDFPIPVVPSSADDLVLDVEVDVTEVADSGEPDTDDIIIDVRLQTFTTDDRPDPVICGPGAVILDTVLGMPIFSDGTNWKTFDGIIA